MEEIKLTNLLDSKIMDYIGLSPFNHMKYKIYYEGFITKSMFCYDNIIEYYIHQNEHVETDYILSLNTPMYTEIYSTNGITYMITLSNKDVCFLSDIDLNAIFKHEAREYKLNNILNG